MTNKERTELITPYCQKATALRKKFETLPQTRLADLAKDFAECLFMIKQLEKLAYIDVEEQPPGKPSSESYNTYISTSWRAKRAALK